MEWKKYLVDTFLFNDQANKKMLEKIRQLPDQKECIRYFSHLINSQNKWLKRIQVYPQNPDMDWWEPVYEPAQLLPEWEKSLQAWVLFLESKTEEELEAEVKFVGFDGAHWSAALKDIGLQLNYHSIHHRAQMQMVIRDQGIEPDFIDYIGTKYQKIS